jgi:hypothetical protein
MSALVDRAIEAAGLGDVLAARLAGSLSEEHVARLREADLLAVGALADRVRVEEAGAEVRIYAGREQEDERRDAPLVVLPQVDREMTGLELLREVAVARITGPRAARVRVDWTRCGLELAQVALGFGADELAGRIASKQGLPIAPGELAGAGKKSGQLPAQLVKRRELTAYVTRAGRSPVFVDRDLDGTSPATPGRGRNLERT